MAKKINKRPDVFSTRMEAGWRLKLEKMAQRRNLNGDLYEGDVRWDISKLIEVAVIKEYGNEGKSLLDRI